MTLFGKGVFAHIIKLKIFERDHARLSRWILRVLISVLIRESKHKRGEDDVIELGTE